MKQMDSKTRESCRDSRIQQTKVCFPMVDCRDELTDDISQTPIYHYFFFFFNPPLL